MTANTPTATWTTVLHHPCAVGIAGARGQGKSCLGYYLVEELARRYGITPCVLGLPPGKAHLLPEGYVVCDTPAEAPANAIVFLDEAALQFHSRRSMSASNMAIDRVLSLSRQRGQSLVFATHNFRKLDVALVSDMDALAFKRPSLLHSRFERAEIRPFTQEAGKAFGELPLEEHRRNTYVISESYVGFLENGLPTFWCDALSAGWADASPYSRHFEKHGIFLTPEQLQCFEVDEVFAFQRNYVDREGKFTRHQVQVLQRQLAERK